MRRILCGLAAVSGLVASPAAGAPTDFTACDGYPAPDKKGDGITNAFIAYGLGRIAVRRSDPGHGTAALAACESALADPLLAAGHWLRRAHLLQSKAFHLLMLGRDEEALAALRESDSAVPAGEALWIESGGAGNRALRALALFRGGRAEEARGELDAITAARPYAHSLRVLTRAVRLGFEGTDSYFQVLRDEARFDPGLLPLLFRAAILYGRLDEAAAIHGQISYDLPRRGAWVIEGWADRQYGQIEDRAANAGAMAYVLAAQGRTEAGSALIAEARADLEDSMQRPGPDSSGAVSAKAEQDFSRRLGSAQKGAAVLDRWQEAIALRAAAPTLPLKALRERIDSGLAAETPVAIDILRQAKATTGTERNDRAAAVAELIRSLDEARRSAVLADWRALGRLMPRPETRRSKPKHMGDGTGNGIVLDATSGFYFRPVKGSESLTVGYGNGNSTPSIVEEIGLLAAAMKVRQAGRDSFIIETRMTMERSLTDNAKRPTRPLMPFGYEVRMQIRPVSSASLPTGLESSRWRLIDANEVYRRLTPKFDRSSAETD